MHCCEAFMKNENCYEKRELLWKMRIVIKNENFAEQIRAGVTWYCLSLFSISSLRNVTTSSSSATAWNTTQCPPTGWPWGQSSSLAFCHCHALLPYSKVGISHFCPLLSSLLGSGPAKVVLPHLWKSGGLRSLDVVAAGEGTSSDGHH